MVIIVIWVIIDHTKPPLNAHCSSNRTMTQAWFTSLTGKTQARITLRNICNMVGRAPVNEKE